MKIINDLKLLLSLHGNRIRINLKHLKIKDKIL